MTLHLRSSPAGVSDVQLDWIDLGVRRVDEPMCDRADLRRIDLEGKVVVRYEVKGTLSA